MSLSTINCTLTECMKRGKRAADRQAAKNYAQLVETAIESLQEGVFARLLPTATVSVAGVTTTLKVVRRDSVVEQDVFGFRRVDDSELELFLRLSRAISGELLRSVVRDDGMRTAVRALLVAYVWQVRTMELDRAEVTGDLIDVMSRYGVYPVRLYTEGGNVLEVIRLR